MSHIGFTLSRTAAKPGWTPGNPHQALWLDPLAGLLADVTFDLLGSLARFDAADGDARISRVDFTTGATVAGSPAVRLDWDTGGESLVLALASAWNSIKNIAVSDFGGESLTLSNWVDVDVALASEGPLSVVVEAAKRGEIVLGGTGPHTVVIGVESNVQDWTNHFRVVTGDGNDEVTIRQTALEAVRGLYLGQWTTTDIATGEGDDLIRGWGSNDRADGGAGRDVFVLRGLEAGYRFATVGEVLVVTDIDLTDGNDGTDRLTNFEVIRFASGPDKLLGVAVNRDPVFVADAALTLRPGQTKNFTGASLVANDTDADGDALEVTQFFANTAQGGSVQNTAFDTFTYTPPTNFTGSDTFTYTISDGEGGFANATLTINVVNSGPAAVADAALNLRPGQTKSFTGASLVANDTDADGDVLNVTQFFTETAQGGTVQNTAFDTFTYTPPTNFTGSDTFSYLISDGFGGFVSTTLTINVVNSTPVAVADAALNLRPGQTVDFTGASLVANDTDADGDALNVTQFFVETAQGGTVQNTAFDTFTYTPPANFTGSDTFSYVISDGFGGFVSTTLTINVVNSDPVAVADAALNLRPGQTKSFTGASLVANDTDADGDVLNVTQFFTETAQGGTVQNTAFDTFTYTPPTNFTGSDTFSYLISDGFGGFASATLTINVVNSTPVAVADAPVAVAFNGSASFTGASLVANDTDADSDALNVTQFFVETAQGGTVQNTAFDTFTYTPPAGFSGTDTFSYVVSDGFGGFASATLSLVVAGRGNTAPQASNGNARTNEDTSLPFALAPLVSDAEDNITGFTLGTVLGGTVTGFNAATGTGSFVPNTDYNGPASIAFTVIDAGGLSAGATLAITVSAVNDPITANADSATLAEDGSALIDVLANDTDVDGPAKTIQSVGTAQHGTVVIEAGQVRYTPDADFFGADSFTYIATDTAGSTSSTTVSVTVTPVNDAPVAANESFETSFGITLVVVGAGVLDNDDDIDSPDLNALLVTGPANGMLALNEATGAFAYIPNAGFSGTDSFTYRATDGDLTSNLATVTITVAPPAAVLELGASGRAFITGTGTSSPFLLVTTPEGLTPNFHPNTSLHQGILEIVPGSNFGVGVSAATNLGGTQDLDGIYDAYLVNATTGEVRVLDPLPGISPIRTSEVVGYTSEGEFVIQTTGNDIFNKPFAQVFLYDPDTEVFTALPGGANSTVMSKTRSNDRTTGIDTDDFIFNNRLTFESTGAAVAGDTDGRTDAYIFDLLTDSVIALDATAGGVQGNGTSRFSGEYGYAILQELGSPFTPNGEWVIFETNSTNLGLPTTIFAQPEAERDMLVARNMATGQLVRIDSRADGAPAIDPGTEAAMLRGFTALSGNRILFQSDDYLVDGMSGTGLHLFVKDLDDGSIMLVDSLADGTPSGPGGVELEPLDTPGVGARPQDFGPINWQGQDYQLFQAESARLMGLPDSTPGFQLRDRIYVKNLDTGYVYDISIDAGAAAPTTSDIGNDKQYVGDGWLLGSRSALLTHLASDAGSRLPNINLMTREDGTVATGSALVDWLGGDLFRVTTSANLLPEDTDGFRDLYLVEVDRATGTRTITLTGSASDGTPGLTDSFPDAFPTDIPNVIIVQTTDALVADDIDGQRDIYLKNFVTGAVTLLDRDFNGASGNSSSGLYSVFLDDISQVRLVNGKLIFATSTAMVATDTDGQRDTYLVDPFGVAAPILLDAATDGTNGNGASGSPFDTFFLTPEWVRFASTSTNLVPGVGNGTDALVYLKNIVTGVVVPGQTTEAGTPFFGADNGGPFLSVGQLPGTINGLRLFATNLKLAENDLNGLYDEYYLDPLSNIVPWTQGTLAEVTLSASFPTATSATFTWGDGDSDTSAATGGTASATHRYAAGTYTAEISVATPGGPLSGSLTVIAGGTGQDTLTDLAGNTVLAGGLGEDTYVFAAGHGEDTIAGFGPGDVVALAAFGASFDSFTEILAATTDTAAGARIDTGGGNSILIQGVAKSGLVFTDFDAPRPNVAPVAVTDVYTVFGTTPLTMPATASFGTAGFLNNDRDEWGGTLSVLSVETPSVGTLTSQATGAFTYTAPTGFFGLVEFGYVVTDGEFTANGTVRMNVVNSRALNAENNSYSVTQGQTLVVNAIDGVLTNDLGAIGPTTVNDAAFGTFVADGKGTLVMARDGSFTFAADADFVGLVEFSGVGLREVETGREDGSSRLSITVLDDGIFIT